jgi:hypothetical protein
MASLAESQATPPLDALAESQPRNPFTDVVAWDPFPPIAFKPDDSVFDREPDPDVSESLRATFRAFAAYANDDGVCWPSEVVVQTHEVAGQRRGAARASPVRGDRPGREANHPARSRPCQEHGQAGAKSRASRPSFLGRSH